MIFLNSLIRIFLFFFLLSGSLLIAQEDSAYEISNELMCPVCQGQTVAESNSGLAISMREVVKKQLDEGKNKEEILNYFVNIYGDTILAKPPISGFSLILYTTPLLFLCISVIFWLRKVRK